MYFFDFKNKLSIRPVFRRKNPLRSETDHKLLSGLWFHCQTKGNAGSPFLRLNSSLLTIPGIKPFVRVLGGKSSVSGTFPLTPITASRLPISSERGKESGQLSRDPEINKQTTGHRVYQRFLPVPLPDPETQACLHKDR